MNGQLKLTLPKARRRILTGMVHFRRSWAPLAEPLFQRVWFAAFVSDIGSWMHEVAGAWLMTSLTLSPLMIALMQTATYLPTMIIGLPAGAIADMADRRKIVLCGQFWMLCAAAILGFCTLAGVVTPWLLLGLTLLLGIGAASGAPAFGALAPSLVARQHLHSALAIRSSGRHVARGVGSALGGVVLAAAGPAAVLLLNACSVAGTMAVMWRWCAKSPAASRQPSQEGLRRAIIAGFDYTIQNKSLLTTDILTALFGLSASALWALLPLFARKEIGLTAVQYGQMLALFGLGSLLGVTWLSWLRRVASYKGAAAIGVLALALAIAGIACARIFFHVNAAALLGGVAWIVVISALNTSAQLSSSEELRSRCLAIFIFVWQTSLALGSIVWGLIASSLGVRMALAMCAVSLLFNAAIFANAKSFVTLALEDA
jgi:MFS family permease